MSSQNLHATLLRTPIIQILRASGFHSTRPAVLDTLTDIAIRYLQLLCSSTADYARHNHGTNIPDITDVRMALQDVGAFVPQVSSYEETLQGEEDMRGVDNFLAWMKGDIYKEIRRVAGMIPTEGEAMEMEGLEDREDFLTSLKKKHSKTGEEARYQGTVLGKGTEERHVVIEGGIESIRSWEAHQRSAQRKRGSASPLESPLSSPNTVMATPTDTDSMDM